MPVDATPIESWALALHTNYSQRRFSLPHTSAARSYRRRPYHYRRVTKYYCTLDAYYESHQQQNRFKMYQFHKFYQKIKGRSHYFISLPVLL
jgi:hypothetical protein